MRWPALAVLCVSLLIINLDNTVLNVALPTLVRDLHATLQRSAVGRGLLHLWSSRGCCWSAGSLADRVGRKRTFLAGLAAFAAGSGLGCLLRLGGYADRRPREHGQSALR